MFRRGHLPSQTGDFDRFKFSAALLIRSWESEKRRVIVVVITRQKIEISGDL